MRTLVATLGVVLLLGACAPGTYTIRHLEWNGGTARAHDTAHVGTERPDPGSRAPQVGHPVIDVPPVVRPEPPVTPPVTPPVVPPVVPPVEPPAPEPADPYAGCRIKEMPPKSANERIVKCPGQPAIVIKRP